MVSGGGAVSANRHAALVEFEITGNAHEAIDRVAPSRDAVDSVQATHRNLVVDQFGSASTDKELNKIFGSDLAQAEIQISGGVENNQALASIPSPSGAGDIAWWMFTVLVFASLVYYAVRRRQV